jgi:hypothetical protein
MYDWQSEMAIQRQRDMLREAQQYRLVREARACMDKHSRWSSRALCWLGVSLVTAGRWLQSRSGAAPAQGGNLVFLVGRETASSRQSSTTLRKVA